MLLRGSCHCKKVTFEVVSHTPYPVSTKKYLKNNPLLSPRMLHCIVLFYVILSAVVIFLMQFNLCYCSICRKTGKIQLLSFLINILIINYTILAGHGGCAINIMGDFSTLKYTGAEFIKVYQVKRDNGELSPHKRHFCSECVSHG